MDRKWAFPVGHLTIDNDGWLDIFAPSYDRTLEDMVLGLIGRPHKTILE